MNAVGSKSGSIDQSTATVTGGFSTPPGTDTIRAAIKLSSNLPASTADQYFSPATSWSQSFSGVPDTISHHSSLATVRLQYLGTDTLYHDYATPKVLKPALYRDFNSVTGFHT